MEGASKRTVVAAFLANLAVAVAKFGAFVLTGSASMLAESIHSVADTGNQALLFLGGARANQPADARHPFGYGAERYFWAFVVALVLFSLGSLFSLWEGLQKVLHPHQLDDPTVAFVVLAVAFVAESMSLRTARREARPLLRGRTWWGFIRQTKTPELPVVLLEDTGALIGLVVAALGLAAATITGNERYDAIGSMGIGVLLGAIAIVLAIETKSLLIGEGAGPRVDAAIRAAIEAGADVRRVIHLRTLQLGPDELLLAAKVDIDAPDTATLAAAIDAAERRVREAVPSTKLIYLEPDRYRSDEAEASHDLPGGPGAPTPEA